SRYGSREEPSARDSRTRPPDLPRRAARQSFVRRGPPRRAASAMRGRQAGPRGRGAALLPLCGAAAAVLLFLAQGPMGWVGCSQQHPGRRGGGGRCGPVARGAVEVHEIRSRIKEDQGKSWIELNIGQMGHTANITWARWKEHGATDSWMSVNVGGASAKYTHRVAGGEDWDTTAYTWDVNKTIPASHHRQRDPGQRQAPDRRKGQAERPDHDLLERRARAHRRRGRGPAGCAGAGPRAPQPGALAGLQGAVGPLRLRRAVCRRRARQGLRGRARLCHHPSRRSS
ncbi:unnamed protein product, partial [Prorocentrum cordatum]